MREGYSHVQEASVAALRYCDFVEDVQLVERERDFERRKRLQSEVIASIRGFRATDRLTREEIHDRKTVDRRSPQSRALMLYF